MNHDDLTRASIEVDQCFECAPENLPYHKDAIDHFGIIDGAKVLGVVASAKIVIPESMPLIHFIRPQSVTRLLIDHDPEYPFILVRSIDYAPPLDKPEGVYESTPDEWSTCAVAHFGSIEGAIVDAVATKARNALTVLGLSMIPPDACTRYIVDYDPNFYYLLVRSVPVMSVFKGGHA